MEPEKPIAQAPTITPEEIAEALRKGAASARELDLKLGQVFRPPTPREDFYLRGKS